MESSNGESETAAPLRRYWKWRMELETGNWKKELELGTGGSRLGDWRLGHWGLSSENGRLENTDRRSGLVE